MHRLLVVSFTFLIAAWSVGCSTTDEGRSASDGSTSEAGAPTSNRERLRSALDDAEPAGFGEVSVRAIEFGRALTIYLRTPEGGFDGPSWDDLDDSAAAAFKAVYAEARYPATRETVIVFQGGLVDTRTGKELPDANTGIYTMKGAAARRIDWSDDDVVSYNIDWSNYRDFAHPALEP